MNLSISFEHFYIAEHRNLSIFFQLIILIWAFICCWAFISEIFFSEHFLLHEHSHLSTFVQLSISIWAFFSRWPFIFLSALFKINHSRYLIQEPIVYSVVCTGFEPNILLIISVSASNNIRLQKITCYWCKMSFVRCQIWEKLWRTTHMRGPTQPGFRGWVPPPPYNTCWVPRPL